MTVYGIGAYYDDDVSPNFITNRVACIGWAYNDSPYLHEMMYKIKIGDLIYIKTYTPQDGLTLKAAGIVINNEFKPKKGLGRLCCDVNWLWSGKYHIGDVEDKFIRTFTLFEEHNPEIQKLVVDLILNTKYSSFKR